MAYPKPTSIALRMVQRSASRAMLGTALTTRKPSVHVCVHIAYGYVSAAKRLLNTCLCCTCAVKVCKCENGVPETGVNCPAHGEKKCKSCDDGHGIDDKNTKCTRTYAPRICVRFTLYASALYATAMQYALRNVG